MTLFFCSFADKSLKPHPEYIKGMFYKLVFIHLGSVLMLGHFSIPRLYIPILQTLT